MSAPAVQSRPKKAGVSACVTDEDEADDEATALMSASNTNGNSNSSISSNNSNNNDNTSSSSHNNINSNNSSNNSNSNNSNRNGNTSNTSNSPKSNIIKRIEIDGSKSPIGEEEEEDLTEADYACLAKTGYFCDIYEALYRARFVAPLLIALALLLVYRVFLQPAGIGRAHDAFEKEGLESEQAFNLIRPVLSTQELLDIQVNTMHAETKFWLPANIASSPTNPYMTNAHPATVKLRWHRHTNNFKDGNFRPPDLFYTGVVFSLTDVDSHKVEFVSRRDLASTDLLGDLQQMHPKPTAVMQRSAGYNVTNWYEEGYAVYFSFKDLNMNNTAGYEYSEEFQSLVDSVISVARSYRLVYVTMWYPHAFGDLSAAKPEHLDIYGDLSPWIFTNIIQQTIPTRTGLNALKSTCVVWMSAVDDSPPANKDRIVEKDWGAEGTPDHWASMQRTIPEEERMKPLKIKPIRVIYEIDKDTYGEFPQP